MSSQLPRSKEVLLFAWRANASAPPLFPAGGETDWRIGLPAAGLVSVMAMSGHPLSNNAPAAFPELKRIGLWNGSSFGSVLALRRQLVPNLTAWENLED